MGAIHRNACGLALHLVVLDDYLAIWSISRSSGRHRLFREYAGVRVLELYLRRILENMACIHERVYAKESCQNMDVSFV